MPWEDAMQPERGQHSSPSPFPDATRDAPASARDNLPDGAAAIEERLRRATLFDALVDATGLLAWTTTPQGKALEDSPTWRAFTGQAPDA